MNKPKKLPIDFDKPSKWSKSNEGELMNLCCLILTETLWHGALNMPKLIIENPVKYNKIFSKIEELTEKRKSSTKKRVVTHKK